MRVLHWTPRVLGYLLVGALSNPLWLYILRPLIGHTRDWVLDLATLGVQSFKDNIYVEVARGFHELSGAGTFLFLVIFQIAAVTLLLLWTFLRFRSIKERYSELLDEKDTTDGQEVETRMSSDEIRESLGRYERSQRKYFYLLIPAAIMLVTLLLLLSAQVLYVNSAVSHFHQILRIASPYLDEGEEAFILSEFAQIHNKEDYVRIVERLVTTARMNGQDIPIFDPW